MLSMIDPEFLKGDEVAIRGGPHGPKYIHWFKPKVQVVDLIKRTRGIQLP